MTLLQTLAPLSADAGDLRRVGLAGATQYFYNFSLTNLLKWQSAKANIMAGVSHEIVALVGDSTTKGAGASAITAYSRYLADLLELSGIPATDDSIFGTTFGGADLATFDTRLTFNGGWTNFGGISVGGPFFTTPSAGTVTFTPRRQIDTADIFDITASGAGSYNINFDGGASLLSVNQNAANAATKRSVSGSLGTHAINIVRAAGTNYFVGIAGYNSAKKSARLMNLGWSGSTAEQWDTNINAWDPKNYLKFIAPKLTILCLGINNWRLNGAAGVAAYKTAMLNLIAAAKVSGDVIIVTPSPSDVSDASMDTQALYIQAMYELADAADVPLIDLWSRWVSYAVRQPLGWMDDVRHPTARGYADEAAMIARALFIA